MHSQSVRRAPSAASFLRSAEVAGPDIHRIAPSFVQEVRA